MLLEDMLKHHGIKGMRWGVRRDRNRPGGADGKEESEKVKDKRSNLTKKLDSLKRERQWNKVLRNMNALNTKDINTITSRIKLENSLKTLSKSKVGSKKDQADYLRRQYMSDAELSRKVVRLRAKENLHKAVRDATKGQREFGEKVTRIGGTLGVKYAVNKSIGPKDIFDTVTNPKKESNAAKESILKKVKNPDHKDALKYVLDKIDKPDKK